MSVDDGAVRAVRVNGRPARPLVGDYSRWEVEVEISGEAPASIVAEAVDEAGNVEPVPHRVHVPRTASAGVARLP